MSYALAIQTVYYHALAGVNVRDLPFQPVGYAVVDDDAEAVTDVFRCQRSAEAVLERAFAHGRGQCARVVPVCSWLALGTLESVL